MMKRYISLSLLCLATVMSSQAQEAFTEGDLSFLPTGANTVSVNGYTPSPEPGAIVTIPETITHEGTIYSVTAIAKRAFAQADVAAIYMPSTITTIADEAFLNCKATFIRLSPSVTAIGRRAFEKCQRMGHLDLPEKLEQLQDSALMSSSLYTIGKSSLSNLTTVGNYAVSHTSLSAFPLTDALTQLGHGAFEESSRLASIHLPASLKAIPDHLLQGCSAISEVTLPAGTTHIGAYALAGTGIKDIDLAHYQGTIGGLAFNDCKMLERLTLPEENANCYTSENGKVLYDRASSEILSVLPSVDRLIVTYPATGFVPTSDGGRLCALTGYFPNLTELELPHSWDANLTPLIADVKKLTLRMPTAYFEKYAGPLSAHPTEVYAFEYAHDALTASEWTRILTEERNEETNETSYTNLFAINRPTKQLYMAEVMPMYPGLKMINGQQGTAWTADWNSALEQTFPQYFTNEECTLTSNVNYKRYDAKLLYRSYMVEQYMTAERFNAYRWHRDSVVQCLDGKLFVTSQFEPNNYVNWYLHDTFVAASDVVNPGVFGGTEASYQDDTFELLDTDSTWGVDASKYVVSTPDKVTQLYYALRMVPGVSYNIYAVFPPRHPYSTEELACKNQLRTQMHFIQNSRVRRSSYTEYELTYDDNLTDTLLLFEGYEPTTDFYNVLEISSRSIRIAERNQGYTYAIPLIGVLAVPQTEFEMLPDGVMTAERDEPTMLERYDLQGRRLTSPQRGVNILRMSNGSVRKVLIR